MVLASIGFGTLMVRFDWMILLSGLLDRLARLAIHMNVVSFSRGYGWRFVVS
jgi:hypothetical protein